MLRQLRLSGRSIMLALVLSACSRFLLRMHSSMDTTGAVTVIRMIRPAAAIRLADPAIPIIIARDMEAMAMTIQPVSEVVIAIRIIIAEEVRTIRRASVIAAA